MKINVSGIKSRKNVHTAFALEAQARNKYSIFAEKAREEGREELAVMFERMADNEKEHAKIWFTIMKSGALDSETNLKDSARGENLEWKSIYPVFAREAREEGEEELAVMFEKIASIEYDHERQFVEAILKMHQEQTGEKEKKKAETVKFYCIICGFVSVVSLDVCPTCGAKQSFSV